MHLFGVRRENRRDGGKPFVSFWKGFALASALLGGSLSSCGEGALDSDKVSPDSIWGQYAVESLESSDQLRMLASFRLKKESGASVDLKDPSRVEASPHSEGLFLTLSPAQDLGSFGSGYEAKMPLDESVKEVLFVWTDPKGNRVQNVVPRLVSPRFDAADLRRDFKQGSSLQVRFREDTPRDVFGSGATFTCQLITREPAQDENPTDEASNPFDGVIGAPEPSDPPSGTLVRQLEAPAKGSEGCFFTADQMKRFVPGAALLQVVGELRFGGVSGHKAGGQRVSRTFGRAEWLQVSKPSEED